METKETECTQLLLLLGEGRPWLLVAKLPEETLGTFSGQYCLLSTLGFLGCQAVKRVISRGKEDVKECLRLQRASLTLLLQQIVCPGTCNSSVRKCKETTLGQNTITILPSMEAVLKHGDLTLLHLAMAAGSICGPLSESGQSHFLPTGDLSYEVVRCQAGKFKHRVT